MVPNSWLHRCNWCIISNYTQLNKSTVLIPSLTYVATWIALKKSLVFWALAIASSCYLASRPVSSLASWLHMLTSPHTHTYLHTMPQWKTLLHVHMMMIKQITSDRFVPKHTCTHIAPTRSTLIPKSHSCLHRKVEFVSFTKPFKISSPMTAYGWKNNTCLGDLYSQAHVSVLATNQSINSKRIISRMREVAMNNYKHVTKLTDNPCRQLIASHFARSKPRSLVLQSACK